MRGATVLYHILDFQQEKRLTTLCKRQGLLVRSVTQRDADTPIGVLAGVLPKEAHRQSACPLCAPLPEFLVFSGLSMEQMDRFLDAYREAGPKDVLKARLTPHNLSWSVRMLTDELTRERAKLEGK